MHNCPEDEDPTSHFVNNGFRLLSNDKIQHVTLLEMRWRTLNFKQHILFLSQQRELCCLLDCTHQILWSVPSKRGFVPLEEMKRKMGKKWEKLNLFFPVLEDRLCTSILVLFCNLWFSKQIKIFRTIIFNEIICLDHRYTLLPNRKSVCEK